MSIRRGRVSASGAVVALLTLVVALSGCGDSAKDGTGLHIVATTGHINDAVLAITKGTDPQVDLLCGPGVDPHSYDASIGDAKKMEAADLIIFNGFHLEALLEERLHGVFAKKSWAMSSAFPKDARLDWVEDGEVDPKAPFDPHIWNHLLGWATCVESLATRLGEADPDNAATYTKNGKAYADEVRAAHAWASKELAGIPADRRFLVSGHDAFNYFAKAYGLETVAVLGVGNDQEADIQTMISVGKVIAERKVPVIFMESLTNPQVTRALKDAAKGHGWEVEIAHETLYSDDLGESAPQDTYLGAFRSNVTSIRDALK